MKFYFHPDADAELGEAIRYYEECQIGLGLDMAEEVCSAIQRHPTTLKPGPRCRRTQGGAS